MSNQSSKEQIAHDLSVAYEICCTINPDTIENPSGFVANYEKDYKEFLELLSK